MAEFIISDQDLASLNGKVAIVTGGSSGIGLAMVSLLLHHGAIVVSADLSPSPVDDPKHTFQKANVASWSNLLALFNLAKEKYGRIDHVHANAGIGGRANYIGEEFDESGQLKEPSQLVYDVNLRACVNTAYLGIYHMRHQSPPGGSIVLTASASSFQQFRVTDYTTAKHGVLGFMRGVVPLLKANDIPIRVNAIGPSWTLTGLVPQALVDTLKGKTQGPEIAAKSAAICMADEKRQGNFIYSWEGRYLEIERARLLPVAAELMGNDGDTGEQLGGEGEAKIDRDIGKILDSFHEQSMPDAGLAQ